MIHMETWSDATATLSFNAWTQSAFRAQRGLSQMMSAKNFGNFDPPPPRQYQFQATFLPLVRNWPSPSPPHHWRHVWMAPNTTASNMFARDSFPFPQCVRRYFAPLSFALPQPVCRQSCHPFSVAADANPICPSPFPSFLSLILIPSMGLFALAEHERQKSDAGNVVSMFRTRYRICVHSGSRTQKYNLHVWRKT